MNLILILLSLSLSLDALAAGFSYGCRRITIPISSLLVTGLISTTVMVLAMLCGNLLTLVFNPFFAERIGVVLLFLIGLRLVTLTLLNGRNGKNGAAAVPADSGVVFSLAMRWLGIVVQVIKHPEAVDIDSSGLVDLKEAFVLGLALSVDSFGVGLAIAISGFPLVATSLCTGLAQVLFLLVGQCSSRFIKRIFSDSWVLSVLPGGIILAIALVKLFQLGL
ncbi:MAG: hypothetical protein HPY50_07755 [Firmicutes bacterium]|nr:hypothetical protein [Bacillota bacterium]